MSPINRQVTDVDDDWFFDCLFMSLILVMIDIELQLQFSILQKILRTITIGTAYTRRQFSTPTNRRRSFTSVMESTTDTLFKRKFQMSKQSFMKLCDSTEQQVGEKEFKGESYINSSEYKIDTQAACNGRGGIITGEMKVALLLRVLAGGNYLDIMDLSIISVPALYNSFHLAIHWINVTFDFCCNNG